MTESVRELRANGVSEAVIAVREWRRQRGLTLKRLASGARSLYQSDLSMIEIGRATLTLTMAEKIWTACKSHGLRDGELPVFEAELARLRTDGAQR
jgi:hypothetical protein